MDKTSRQNQPNNVQELQSLGMVIPTWEDILGCMHDPEPSANLLKVKVR